MNENPTNAFFLLQLIAFHMQTHMNRGKSSAPLGVECDISIFLSEQLCNTIRTVL